MRAKKPAQVEFIVPRYTGCGVETVAVVTACTVHREEADFVAALGRALTAWFKTKAGRDAWRTSCADFNIGDLSLVLGYKALNRFLDAEGIRGLNVVITDTPHATGQWDFDTVLGEGEELDAQT